MAVAVALLMIGGEFDLSAGAMTGITGLITGIMMTHWDTNVWVAIVISLVAALVIGFLNGFLVMKTGLPSFIVTLGTFFVLRGVNLAVIKQIINQVSVVDFQSRSGVRRRGASCSGPTSRSTSAGCRGCTRAAAPHLTIYAATFWAIAVVIIATWVLQRTRAGNWIFAVGRRADQRPPGRRPGLRDQGRAVHDHRRSPAGWSACSLFKTTTAQSTTGVGQEFVYIICAVVGGCLLTGGYGSAIGARARRA